MPYVARIILIDTWPNSNSSSSLLPQLENFFTRVPTSLYSDLFGYISQSFDSVSPLLFDCEFLEGAMLLHFSVSTVLRNKSFHTMFVEVNLLERDLGLSVNRQVLWEKVVT